MATEDNTNESGRNAAVSQLLEFSDRLDNASFGVVACRMRPAARLAAGPMKVTR